MVRRGGEAAPAAAAAQIRASLSRAARVGWALGSRVIKAGPRSPARVRPEVGFLFKKIRHAEK